MTEFEKQLLDKINDLQSTIDSLNVNKQTTPNFIFVVFGNAINNNHINITSIKTLVVPNIGEEIYFDKKHYLVTGKVINYQQVFKYAELDNPDRGGEMITLFVTQRF